MAELKIEKKKPIWPWILFVLVILGIIAYFVYADPDYNDPNDDFDDDFTNEQVIDSESYQSDTSRTDNTFMPGTSYDQYTAFEGSIRDSTRIAVDTSYTKKAYYNLCKAVAKMAEENEVEDSQALTDLKEFSMLITKVSSPLEDAETAKNFKTASDKIVTVLEDIQEKSYPSLQSQVADLKGVSSKMDGSISMDQQQDDITQFLQKSRDVLKEMNK